MTTLGPTFLIVSTYFPPHVGGVEVLAQGQARVLADRGYNVVVATTLTDPGAARTQVCDGYLVYRMPAGNAIERRSGIPYPVVGYEFCRTLWNLVRWCDIVHVHDVLYQPPQLAALMAHRARKPLYVTQHVANVCHDSPFVRGIQRASNRLAGRYIWRRARRIVAMNSKVREHLLIHGVPADRIVDSTIRVDTTVFTPGPVSDERRVRVELRLPPDTPLVLFVGRLIRQKGYHQLIGAAGNGYHIVLAGPGAQPPALPAGVTCVGPLDHARLLDLYRLATVVVIPSTGEVFCTAAREAMACGRPVVLADGPHYDDFGVDRELIRFVAPQPRELRSAITDIVNRPDLRERMAVYSRRFAEERFDRRAASAEMAALYGPLPAPEQREGDAWISRSSS